MGRTLVVEITGDTRKLQQALSGTQSGMQKLGRTARVAGLAVAGGLAVAFKVGLDEMVASQKVMAQTEAVIKSTGGAANVTAEHVDELAQEMLKLSGVDDELIDAGENVLLTFRGIRNEVGAGNDIFDQATLATLDLSVAMGRDLNSSAVMVGKALQDPARGLTALRRVGVQFTAAQEEAIKKMVETGDVMGAQKMILAELTKEFGGSAEAAGTKLPAQLARAREAFADVSAGLVEQLLPAMTATLGGLLRFTEFLKENPNLAKAMVIGLAALSAALITASVAQMALNLAVLANPYVAAAVAIVALVVGLVVLWKKSEFVRKYWQLLLLGVGASVVVFVNVAKAIIRNIDTIVAAFNKVWDVARAVFPYVASAIRGLLSPILVVISAVQRLIGLISSINLPFGGSPGPGIFSGTGAGPRGARAHGGPVSAFGAYTVGERGPETLVMGSRGGRIIPNRGGATTSGTGRFLVLTDAEGVAFLQSLNGRHMRGNGGRSIW